MMLKKGNGLLTAIAVSIFITTAVTRVNAITIAKNGKAKAVIVVDAEADAAAQHAALELSSFLRQITGGNFQIVHKADSSRARLLVGKKAAKAARPKFRTDGLGRDGVAVKTMGNDIILAGDAAQGTLYSVYTFLEDYVGCRWWSSAASYIPKKPTLKIGRIDTRFVPPLESREVFWFSGFHGDWIARNKLNACNAECRKYSTTPLDAQRGGLAPYMHFGHSFMGIIPPGTYFDTHPEWFSKIKGKRIYKPYFSSLCLTNEGMRAEFVKNLKEMLRKNPDITITSVSQPDGKAPDCQCVKCSAINEKEGAPSGAVIDFVNFVAAGIEKEFPDVTIDTFAYHSTQKPPKYVKPRHNVLVRLCSSMASHSKPYSDDVNKEFRDDLVGWSNICDKLYIWDYTTDFRHYILPFPSLHTYGPNIRFLINHNVKGIFEQGTFNTNGSAFSELRAWMLAKLLWDPERDWQKLVEEFVNGYYGEAAAPHLLAYIKLMRDAVEESGDYLDHRTPPTAKYLSFETLCKGWRHLDAASNAIRGGHLDAASNAARGELKSGYRIRTERMPIMYVFMMRWEEFRRHAKSTGAQWPMWESVDEAFTEFKRIAKHGNIMRIKENFFGFRKLEDAIESMEQ